MGKSEYGTEVVHHALKEGSYETNFYNTYRPTIQHNFHQNFKCQKLNQAQAADGTMEDRQPIFINLTGLAIHLNETQRKHKGTHVDLMELVLNQRDLREALKPLAELDPHGYNLVWLCAQEAGPGAPQLLRWSMNTW